MALLVLTSQPECPAPIDEPPGNFDATTQPILATHWFGPARKQAGRSRPLGPGEEARAYELRKRGAHVRLIHSKVKENSSMSILKTLARLDAGEILSLIHI